MKAENVIRDGTVALVMALFADYARHLDLKRDPAAWAELFDVKGILAVGDREIKGRDALRDFAAGSVVGVHVQAVPLLQVRANGGLDATTSFAFFTTATLAWRAGYYLDHLTRQGDRYRFAQRRISIVARTD